MTITLKLLESVDDIEKNILSAIATQFNQTLIKNKSKILSEIINVIPKWISDQPEMQSLLSGGSDSLIGQFGITMSPSSIVNAIINAVVSSANISITPYNNKLQNGGIELNIQPENFQNLLGLSQGHTVYNGGDLHWLNWLLMRGDEILIVGYEYNPQTGIGRSGVGNMRKGTSFRVPPQFSGTDRNNFITRALIGPEPEQTITKIFKKVLGA